MQLLQLNAKLCNMKLALYLKYSSGFATGCRTGNFDCAEHPEEMVEIAENRLKMGSI